ncbi:Transcriptional regulator OS=Streptomyces fumanus OX=67302 GN=GCM10018772_40870 PE=4 SV=1 [Streptomyces fumanus]
MLTAQELHVARLAAEGYSNKQIADQLYLSHRTVGAHLYSAYAKLQINRRAQLPAALAGTSD